jgi:hypothetical protein
MPSNTNVANAKALFDALADFKDKTVDGPTAALIAAEFMDNLDGAEDNETKAAAFLQKVFDIIRGTGRSHAETHARQDNDAVVEAAADAAASNF